MCSNFKLTQFILELMTALTLSQRKLYAQHTNLHYNCFVKLGNAECVQSKPYRVLTPVNSNLPGDYKIRAEDRLEMFKNYTRQS